MNWERDCKKALTFIEEHELRDKIISMYIKGPPKDTGFSWWQNDTPEFRVMHGFILDMDYDSSAYACMHRKIQAAIRDMYNHRASEKTVTTVAPPVILRIQTERMDSPNRKAVEVWQEKGPAAACKHMFEQAAGDYAKMRSMYG